MEGNKRNHFKLYVLAVVLMVLLLIMFIGSFNNGIGLRQNNSSIKNYKSIDELMNNTSLDLEIPEYILNKCDGDVYIESIMGQFIQINKSDFVLKIALFVDNNADTLGLYDKSSVDKMYIVKDDDMSFFRYRTGHEIYNGCTLINWVKNGLAYGLMLDYIVSEDEALEILNISKEKLQPTNSKEGNNTNIIDDINLDTSSTLNYTIGDNINIDLPKFESDLNIIDANGIAQFYINKKLIFVILYNEYDINSGTYDGHKEIIINDDIVIKYIEENPFEKGTEAYNDYDKFITTIDNISNSIKYQ